MYRHFYKNTILSLCLLTSLSLFSFNDLTEADVIYSSQEIVQIKEQAESGVAKAQCNLADIYYYGLGVDMDRFSALKWYKEAAKNGYVTPSSAFNIAECYFSGCGMARNRNYEEAFKWYRISANKGHAEAQYQLGFLYKNGEGTAKDEAEGFRWWLKAAEQGFTNAQYDVGIAYINGYGVSKNRAEGIKWLQKAATKNHKAAIETLKNMEHQ
ncbi:sel1 repeat family protein [bacterium]|nr:sel1 repeat family protein [bacterium]